MHPLFQCRRHRYHLRCCTVHTDPGWSRSNFLLVKGSSGFILGPVRSTTCSASQPAPRIESIRQIFYWLGMCGVLQESSVSRTPHVHIALNGFLQPAPSLELEWLLILAAWFLMWGPGCVLRYLIASTVLGFATCKSLAHISISSCRLFAVSIIVPVDISSSDISDSDIHSSPIVFFLHPAQEP